ncbi:MAG TPA: hypothetical protein VHO26_03030 [Propionibacteriaceae bacterium]|nr:hypothetical protein [Propionibacteriaceae bacterium]
MARRSRRRRRLLAPLLTLAVLLALAGAIGGVVWHLVTGRKVLIIPPSEQCIVTVGTTTTSLDLEQSGNAAIIVAESIRRGLAPRAASIALATAMQESRLRNLDYGDQDSIGLFQQRPSQGWGSKSQLLDPWYSSGKFYAALVRVKDWQTADINNVAQAVQRSGVPNGYRQHVEAARAFASALTGNSPASLSCVNRATTAGNARGLADFLARAFPRVTTSRSGNTVTATASDPTTLWAIAQLSMMTTGVYGVDSATVTSRAWHNDGQQVAAWATAGTPVTGVQITVRS